MSKWPPKTTALLVIDPHRRLELTIARERSVEVEVDLGLSL